LIKNQNLYPLVKLYFAKDSIICNFEHPFFVNNTWIAAKDLKAGDSLFEYSGYKVAKIDLSKVENTIDMSRQLNGTYYLRVIIGEQTETFKIIKMD